MPGSREYISKKTAMHRLVTALIVLFSLGAIPSTVRQYRLFLEAYEHQREGDHAGAGKIYAALISEYPDGFLRREALFNIASSEYAQNRFLRSSAFYSVLQTSRGKLGVSASYNRGNALAMAAFADRKAPGYREQLRTSLAAYRKALLADPDHSDARVNYEIVLRELRRLTPPPSRSGGGGGGGGSAEHGQQSRQQGLSADISKLILDNASLQENQMLRKYFRPAPPRQHQKEQMDW